MSHEVLTETKDEAKPPASLQSLNSLDIARSGDTTTISGATPATRERRLPAGTGEEQISPATKSVLTEAPANSGATILTEAATRTGTTALAEAAHADKVFGAVQLVSAEQQAVAHEIIQAPGGQSQEIPLTTKLTAGDHTVKLNSGREFMVHVPESDGKSKLPVMFVFAGSAHGEFDIKNFVPESGMNTVADEPSNKFVTVFPLPLKHMLGTGSDKAAFGWNVLDPKGGVLIDKTDSKNAGYDDLDFVKKVVSVVPQLADVDPSHKDWAAVGFSQGGVFLNYLTSNVPELFPTVGLVGTAMQNNYKYDVKQGNAENVAIVNLRADQKTLPFKNNENFRYKLEYFLHAILPKSRFETLNDLAAINNLKSDPGMQQSFYLKRLGKHPAVDLNTFSTPAESVQKDKGAIYKSIDAHSATKQVAVFDLPTAQHSYPEKDPSGARTNAGQKYTEFDTNRHIVDLWMKYNKDARK